jgi:hypothetical protein
MSIAGNGTVTEQYHRLIHGLSLRNFKAFADENPLKPIETIALRFRLARFLAPPKYSWHTALFTRAICKSPSCWRPSIFTEYTIGL